jgi:hypothetical protein
MNEARSWAIALVVALAAGGIAFTTFSLFDDSDPLPPLAEATEENDIAAVSDFLAAWERFRLGTFVITSEFTRTLDDGSVLTAPRALAQAPPVRITSEFADTAPSVEAGDVSCVSDEFGFFSCLDTGLNMEAYAEEIRAEQIVFASYLSGTPPLYVLNRLGDGCFGFLIAQAVQLPPYGSRAEFCFDAETGALLRQLIIRDTAQDEVVALEVRTDVQAEDLQLAE